MSIIDVQSLPIRIASLRQYSAALIAIFLIPVTYYVERFADRRGERAARDAMGAGTN